jgi:hypothetical protein
VDGAKCKATELYAEDKLNDPEYLNFQMRCMLNEGECDEVGNLIKRKPLFEIMGQSQKIFNGILKLKKTYFSANSMLWYKKFPG